MEITTFDVPNVLRFLDHRPMRLHVAVPQMKVRGPSQVRRGTEGAAARQAARGTSGQPNFRWHLQPGVRWSVLSRGPPKRSGLRPRHLHLGYFVFCFSTTIDMSATVCASLHLARRVPRKCELPDLRCKWPQTPLAPDARGSKCNPTARILSALRSIPSSERHSKTRRCVDVFKGKGQRLHSFFLHHLIAPYPSDVRAWCRRGCPSGSQA
jgi:hypothetical protein